MTWISFDSIGEFSLSLGIVISVAFSLVVYRESASWFFEPPAGAVGWKGPADPFPFSYCMMVSSWSVTAFTPWLICCVGICAFVLYRIKHLNLFTAYPFPLVSLVFSRARTSKNLGGVLQATLRRWHHYDKGRAVFSIKSASHAHECSPPKTQNTKPLPVDLTNGCSETWTKSGPDRGSKPRPVGSKD